MYMFVQNKTTFLILNKACNIKIINLISLKEKNCNLFIKKLIFNNKTSE